MDMAAMITPLQRSKIFALCNETGIDNDLLHELIYAEAGCTSIRQLTMAQAQMVIDRLEGKMSPKGMATPKQRRFIESLTRELGWMTADRKADMERLEGFLKARFKVSSYKWLTVKKAGQVIEALKEMKTRAKTQDLQEKEGGIK